MAQRYLQGIKRNPLFTEQIIKLIPKTDLHCHLDGSIRIETLVELAKQPDNIRGFGHVKINSIKKCSLFKSLL